MCWSVSGNKIGLMIGQNDPFPATSLKCASLTLSLRPCFVTFSIAVVEVAEVVDRELVTHFVFLEDLDDALVGSGSQRITPCLRHAFPEDCFLLIGHLGNHAEIGIGVVGARGSRRSSYLIE